MFLNVAHMHIFKISGKMCVGMGGTFATSGPLSAHCRPDGRLVGGCGRQSRATVGPLVGRWWLVCHQFTHTFFLKFKICAFGLHLRTFSNCRPTGGPTVANVPPAAHQWTARQHAVGPPATTANVAGGPLSGRPRHVIWVVLQVYIFYIAWQDTIHV